MLLPFQIVTGWSRNSINLPKQEFTFRHPIEFTRRRSETFFFFRYICLDVRLFDVTRLISSSPSSSVSAAHCARRSVKREENKYKTATWFLFGQSSRQFTCLSLKDRLCFPLAFCFNIIKFLFLLFSRFVVLALGFWRLGFLVGFSRSARPSYIDNSILVIDINN